MKIFRKTIGYTLIVAYLLYITIDTAIKFGWNAMWLVPVIIIFWGGLGVLIGYLVD